MQPIGLGLSILVPLGLGLSSGYITQSSIKTWYTTLEKPFFTPPNWGILNIFDSSISCSLDFSLYFHGSLFSHCFGRGWF